MGKSLSIEQVKSQVTILKVLEWYGIRRAFRNGSAQFQVKCPFHNHGGLSLTVYNENRFECSCCNRQGDVVDFVAIMGSYRRAEAAKKILEWLAAESVVKQAPPPLPKTTARPNKRVTDFILSSLAPYDKTKVK
jgi:DNA primase